MQFSDTKLPDHKRQYYYNYYIVRAREHSGLISAYSRISNPALKVAYRKMEDRNR